MLVLLRIYTKYPDSYDEFEETTVLATSQSANFLRDFALKDIQNRQRKCTLINFYNYILNKMPKSSLYEDPGQRNTRNGKPFESKEEEKAWIRYCSEHSRKVDAYQEDCVKQHKINCESAWNSLKRLNPSMIENSIEELRLDSDPTDESNYKIIEVPHLA